MSASPLYDPIQKALEHIETDLSRPLEIPKVAYEVGVSSFHFQRLFVRDVGETVAGYIRSRRLERAANILIDRPATNLLDLALECGYQTHSAFTRAFQRHFAMTPSAFVQGGGQSILQSTENARPFLQPAVAKEQTYDMAIQDMPELWLMTRGQAGVANGAFFAQKDKIAGDLQQLAVEDPAYLSSLCGAFSIGPKGFSDPEAVGRYGGLFGKEPESEWGEEVKLISAGEWAVFPHRGPLDRLHMTWNKALRSWLPQSDHDVRSEWMFEVYYAGPDVVDPKRLTAEVFVPLI